MIEDMIPRRLYEVTPQGCWEYTGALNDSGRPRSNIFGMPMFRALCFAKLGPPPSPEYHAAHICHNRRCINPSHGEWQLPEVNNPSLSLSETVDLLGFNVRLKRRKSGKGPGRGKVEGWCAVFRYKGKSYKSGAYTTQEAALRWASAKLQELEA